jgi:hypothetical protein
MQRTGQEEMDIGVHFFLTAKYPQSQRVSVVSSFASETPPIDLQCRPVRRLHKWDAYGQLHMRRYSSALPRNSRYIVAIENGPPARREEGAYLNRNVTDEQRGRRANFHRNPLGRGRLPFLRVARSTRMIQIWVLCAS